MKHIEVWYADPDMYGSWVKPGWYFDAPRDCVGPYQARDEAESARNCFYQNMVHFVDIQSPHNFNYLSN